MAAEYTGRIPKKGDRVAIPPSNDKFEVAAVDQRCRTVCLKLISSDRTEHGVPWTMLVFGSDAGD